MAKTQNKATKPKTAKTKPKARQPFAAATDFPFGANASARRRKPAGGGS
jgi:hypothetical protein